MKNILWYNSLNKPVLTPSDWVFAPVWSILYILMTISLILVVKAKTPAVNDLHSQYFFFNFF